MGSENAKQPEISIVMPCYNEQECLPRTSRELLTAFARRGIALQLDDKAADLVTLRGWAKLRAGDKKGAAKDFQNALKFLPGDASATNGLKESQSATATK